MYSTIYYTSRDFDGVTLVQALPPSVYAVLIEEWTVIETSERTSQMGGTKITKYPVHHVVLLVDQKALNAIRANYIKRLTVHRNVFSHPQYEETNKLFLKVTEEEMIVVRRVIKAFCTALRLSYPLIEETDHGTFIEFAKSDLLPQLVGLLRGYLDREQARVVYARKK